jgi:glycerol kinase
VVLSVDAGTTGVTVLLVTAEAEVIARGYADFAQHFPRPGWVEHAPEEIWQATQTATRAALDAAPDAVVRAVGITNQRETAVLWDRRTLAAPRRAIVWQDRRTLAAPRRAIVWQDRRTSAICERLESAGHGPRVTELTGLRLDPYFTGTKLTWLRENDPRAWAGVQSGQVAVGTIDSYLVARMTSGAAHLTDASNASRTLL